MSTRRGPWAIYGGCCAAMILALVWLTMTVVRLQRAENEALAAADHQERLRLAMWRMDSWLAPLLAREAARPYHEYQSFYAPRRAYTKLLNRLEPGEVLTPSPLLSLESDYFRLHFQLAPDGDLTSPQAPTGNLRDLASELQVSNDRLTDSDEVLAALGASIQPANLNQCVASAETTVNRLAADDVPEMLAAEPPAQPQQRDLGAQLARTQQELAWRRQTYASNAINFDAGDVDESADGVLVGPLVPIWTTPSSGERHRDLLFVRRVRVQGDEYLQGFLCDWPVLRAELLDQVADLFPAARLAPVDVATEDANPGTDVLATIPAAMRVDRPDAAGPILGGTASMALLLSWLAVIAGLGATAVTLRSSINLGQRRSRFASAVTHELRTPLTTFRMYTEMLADDMITDEGQRRQYLRTLRNESGRLSALVENVLSYARLEDGRQALPSRRMSVSELIDLVAPTLARRAEQADMQVGIDGSSANGAEVLTDADAVGQILFNLVDNACKYAADAPVRRIDVTTAVENGHVHLDVRDHGPGVPAAGAGTIFDAFERGANGTSETPGIGLGLALSRDLARELGGSLELVPTPTGPGACFRLTLPIESTG